MTEQELIQKCLEGDKKSLEIIIKSIHGLIFNLALRFLWNRMDAEDATQEILLKIITNLSKFNGKSKFETWAYRVATNYLINHKQTQVEKVLTSFEVYAADLQTFKAPIEYNLPDKDLLEKELKTSCTLAMLQCLNREQRMAFILGSILKTDSKTGAAITNTTPENFRKRVEQSRKRIAHFLNGNCGVFNPVNPCRCSKRINTALVCGRIDKNNLSFTNTIQAYNNEMEELSSMEGLYQNHGMFQSDTDIVNHITVLIANKKIINGA